MSFLPENYSGVPKSNSKYLKFEEGDNKFRILSPAITGWVQWTEDRKPSRSKEKPAELIDQNKPAKHFWAFVVWFYGRGSNPEEIKNTRGIKVVEITQASIQNSIYDLHADEAWGSPLGFDLNVKRKGKDMNDTEYSVIPTPPKPLHPEIVRLYSEATIDLNELYSGGDPFAPKNKQSVVEEENPLMDPNLGPGNPGTLSNNVVKADNTITADDLPF